VEPAQPTFRWVPGIFCAGGGGGKRLGREVDHSLPSVPEIANKWSYACTAPICLHVVDREKFMFFAVRI
jgi:hypothetical protein